MQTCAQHMISYITHFKATISSSNRDSTINQTITHNLRLVNSMFKLRKLLIQFANTKNISCIADDGAKS